MALPIKETPVLKGRDANRFVRNMCEAERNPAPIKEYNRAKKIYDAVKKKEQEAGFWS